LASVLLMTLLPLHTLAMLLTHNPPIPRAVSKDEVKPWNPRGCRRLPVSSHRPCCSLSHTRAPYTAGARGELACSLTSSNAHGFAAARPPHRALHEATTYVGAARKRAEGAWNRASGGPRRPSRRRGRAVTSLLQGGPCPALGRWFIRGVVARAHLGVTCPPHLSIFACLSRCVAIAQRSCSLVAKWSRTRIEDPRFRGSEVRVLRRSRGGHFLLAAYAMVYIGVGSNTGDVIRTFEAAASSPELRLDTLSMRWLMSWWHG
jgi:hypothetical protein